MVGDFAALIPHAGGGASQPSVPGDADYSFDERLPFGFGQILADGEDFDRAMLLPRTALVARRDVSVASTPRIAVIRSGSFSPACSA